MNQLVLFLYCLRTSLDISRDRTLLLPLMEVFLVIRYQYLELPLLIISWAVVFLSTDADQKINLLFQVAGGRSERRDL